jgi:hypothetical protein
METTRKLDDIYYSILEKMSHVQSTISSLQDLSNLTKSLCHGFEEDAIEIQRDVQDQLDAFGGFNTQKSRIESLEWRLKTSKDTTGALTERLDAAHERLRALETQEAEVQATISSKLNKVILRSKTAYRYSPSAFADILGHIRRHFDHATGSFDIAQLHTAYRLYQHDSIQTQCYISLRRQGERVHFGRSYNKFMD